jgi:hypothetical protein
MYIYITIIYPQSVQRKQQCESWNNASKKIPRGPSSPPNRDESRDLSLQWNMVIYMAHVWMIYPYIKHGDVL